MWTLLEMSFLRWLHFLPGSMIVTPALLHLFISSDASTWSQVALPPVGNSHHLLSQFSLGFHETQKGKLFFIAQLINILVLIGIISVIIWEMLCRWISLTSVLLLLGVLNGSSLLSMIISSIANIRSRLIHLQVF